MQNVSGTTVDILASASTEALTTLEEQIEISYLDELNISCSDDFDVTSYINDRFPDENALETYLEKYLSSLQQAIARSDAHLSDLVREQSRQQIRAPKRDINGDDENENSDIDMGLLQEELRALSDAAIVSQKAARDAVEPARPLYAALKNTTSVRSTLDALVKLDESVSVLEAAASSRSLELIATDLSVFVSVRTSLNELSELSVVNGPQSRAVKRLAALSTRASMATDTLRQTAVQQFKAHASTVAAGGDDRAEAVETLQTVCSVAEAIGSDVRAEIISAHVASRVAAFRAGFIVDKSGLAGVERRFAWLRRELRANWKALGATQDKDWGLVFPKEWDVGARLAKAIVNELREWTERELDNGEADVATMVAALGKSKHFEEEMDKRFANAGKRRKEEKNGSSNVVFGKAISESYGPWMGAYVDKEDAHLAGIVRELIKEETWRCEDGNVLNSAKQWFLTIKKSMRQCSALDSRQPLYLLHTVFKKHLAAFASHLARRLPGSNGNALADSSKPSEYSDKVERACAIVTTADYCSTTVQQLEENLRKIVDSSFAADIDMSAECDRFANVAAKGVASLVALLDEDLHLCLRPFKETDWNNWPAVGDTSNYVSGISSSVNRTLPAIRNRLSKVHFRFLLDKYGAAFVATFASHVYRTDNMSHFGAQQILLDTSALRSLLVSLPETGSTTAGAGIAAAAGSKKRAPAPTVYVKNVSREFSKIEAVLKVILAPMDTCIETYLALVPGGSADAFRHILDMRGVRRAEAAPLVLELTRKFKKDQRNLSRRTSSNSDSPAGDLVTLLSGRSYEEHNLRVSDGNLTSLNSLNSTSSIPIITPSALGGVGISTPQVLRQSSSAITPQKRTTILTSAANGNGNGNGNGTDPALKMSASDTLTGAMGAMSASGAAAAASAAQASEVAVDSMKTFFGRFGTSFGNTGIADKIGAAASSLGNTTGILTKEAKDAVARLGDASATSSTTTTPVKERKMERSATNDSSGRPAAGAKESKDKVTVAEMKSILEGKEEELARMKTTFAHAHARLERLSVHLDKYAKQKINQAS